MSIYLKDLWNAFKNVDKKYYSGLAFSNFSSKYDELKKEEYKQFVERVFAYELYHQFRVIIINNSQQYDNLVLNGEITKNGFDDTVLGKARIFPDMVLHKSNTDNSPKNQKLFIEIKVQPDARIGTDIKKLFVAVSPRLNFENAVFICINNNKVELKIKKHIIKNMDYREDKTLLGKLWLINEEGIKNFKDIL